MSPWALCWLLAQASAAPVAGTATTPAAAPAAPLPAEAEPTPPPPPPPPPPRPGPLPPRVVAPPPAMSPFRLSLTYVHVLHADGDRGLADPNTETNAVGIDLAFPSNTYVRNHLGLANQWESLNGVTARGFRIDLVSLGYPIPLVTSTVRLDLEPILTVVRGELMFVTNGPRIFRMESGFSLDLSLTVRHWFVTVQAFGIDFRYWVYTSGSSLTGFAQLFPLRFAIGHEF
jgi:hypothetical protein